MFGHWPPPLTAIEVTNTAATAWIVLAILLPGYVLVGREILVPAIVWAILASVLTTVSIIGVCGRSMEIRFLAALGMSALWTFLFLLALHEVPSVIKTGFYGSLALGSLFSALNVSFSYARWRLRKAKLVSHGP